MKTFTAVGLGEALFDHDLTTDAYHFGGAPTNFAYHFSQCAAFALRGRCAVHVVSAVGADASGIPDAWGVKIAEELAARGIQAELSRVRGARSGIVDKKLGPDGKNNYLIRPAAWDKIAWSASLERLAARTDLACFGSLAQRDPVSRATILRFLDAMPAASFRIFDVNIRQRFYSGEVLGESLRRCNIFKISDEELPKAMRCLGRTARSRDLETICRDLLAAYDNLHMVILTEGAKGSRIFTRNRTSAYLIPDGSCPKPVDTVGAGDSFTAAFCAMLAAGRDIWEAQRTASEVAKFVCSHPSATPVYPADMNFASPPPHHK